MNNKREDMIQTIKHHTFIGFRQELYTEVNGGLRTRKIVNVPVFKRDMVGKYIPAGPEKNTKGVKHTGK